MTAWCIIVCYRPDVARLIRLCQRILDDGSKVILVDNTEAPGLQARTLPDGCELITLGYNSGIAHAQNVGVAAALGAGATVLVFFDQDSRIEPGFLNSLIGPVHAGTPEILSPLCVDEVTGKPLPAVRLNRFGMPTRVHEAGASGPYPVDIVISSGTAATREVFDVAGGFDDGLFIDFVDTEWCLRCRSKKIQIYIIPAAVLLHSIGSRHVSIGPFNISVHGATRCYYQIRNSFLLLRHRHVPFLFSVGAILEAIVGRTLLLFSVEDRSAYIKAYLSGVRDGLKGVTGPRPR